MKKFTAEEQAIITSFLKEYFGSFFLAGYTLSGDRFFTSFTPDELAEDGIQQLVEDKLIEYQITPRVWVENPDPEEEDESWKRTDEDMDDT